MNNTIEKQYKAGSLAININDSKSFACLTFKGLVQLEMLNDSYLLLIRHPSFQNNMNALYDFTETESDISVSDVHLHGNHVLPLQAERGETYKVAFVSNDIHEDALLSMYKLILSKTMIEAEIFNDLYVAEDWLAS